MTETNIFDFIVQEEAAYKIAIPIVEGYEWSMLDHIKKTILYKNSQYTTGNSDDKPFKNIIRPILNLQYRAEGFDVKDIELFVNDAKQYYKSFLIRKFHDKWARGNDIDTFIDNLVESYVDFGGALIKNINSSHPEVTPLQSLAFCDQSDLLSGPFAIKHYFNPSQFLEMKEKGWGKFGTTLEDVITLSKNFKTSTTTDGKQAKTPGKQIEVYEVHGALPKEWIVTDEKETPTDGKEIEYANQMQIVVLDRSTESVKSGFVLYKGREKESLFKMILRDKIFGRALGFGGAEELFEPQVWVNYDVIRLKEMLDIACKVIYQTADQAFANRNKTTDLENGEILVTEDGKTITQINTTPINVSVFERSVQDWEAHAQQMGAANDSIMGVNPTAGTPFKLQELVTEESHGLHEYRKGKISTFVSEIYRDWIIPYLGEEVTKGQEFLSELSIDELQQIADNLVVCEANKKIWEDIQSFKIVDEQEVEMLKDNVRQSFMKAGNKRFLSILKDEMKDAPIDVFVNIAGKQKDMAKLTDKLVNVFRQIISSVNPQTGETVLDDPRMAKIFNQILESSGLSPIDFYQKPKPPIQPVQNVSQGTPQGGLPSQAPELAVK